jgi:hypothetical protein
LAPAVRIACGAAALAAAGALWLQAARGEVPRGPVFDQAALPPGAAWAVDPQEPGPNLPPSGRSLFDFLTRGERVPFPFSALLAEVEARLGRRAGEPSPLKSVLIPLGRSLQRNAAGGEFFRYPRAVVAVDTEPAADGIFLKDRLYLGYHEKAAILEVISYNETAGRFEFQLVRDYKPGGEAKVVYANRAVCTACHQGGGPIFSRPLWNETNANPEVAKLLAAEGRELYGLPISEGVDVPAAIDAATDRANRLAVYQLLWREGCGEGDAAVRCRATAFTGALQLRLSGGLGYDAGEAFLNIARRSWATRWPQGLALPDPDIPNRDPLSVQGSGPVAVSVPSALRPEEAQRLGGLVRSSHVPAVFEPLNPRPPLEVWTAAGGDADGPGRLIAGLAEFLTAGEVRRLDERLFAVGSAPGRPRRISTFPCEISVQPQEANAERIKLKCGDVLEGRLRLDAGRMTGGTIERLESLRDLDVVEGTATVNAGQRQVAFTVAQSLSGLHARRADGNAVERISMSWREDDPKAEAKVVFLADFSAAAAAVETLAASTRSGASDAFSSMPFRRAAILKPLFAELGIPTVACCLDDADLPPPLLEPGGEAGPDDFPEPAIKALYRYCGRCHASPETSPPNFLYGDAASVRANVAHCAERLFFRLDLWRLSPDARPKTPMPPLASLGPSAQSWPNDPALALLRQHAADLLRVETGAAPRLEDFASRGYESLRSCLPMTAAAN